MISLNTEPGTASRKLTPREQRNARIAKDAEHMRKVLRLVRKDPSIAHVAIIGKPRHQQIAKLFRRLCSDGPFPLSIASLAIALRLSPHTVQPYRQYLKKIGLISCVKRSGSFRPGAFVWTGTATL